MTWRVEFTPRANREVRKLDPQQARRIRHFLDDRIEGCEDPRAWGKRLVGDDLWRYRVGDHRILAALDDGQVVVLIVRVAHRREVYRT